MFPSGTTYSDFNWLLEKGHLVWLFFLLRTTDQDLWCLFSELLGHFKCVLQGFYAAPAVVARNNISRLLTFLQYIFHRSGIRFYIGIAQISQCLVICALDEASSI